MKTRPGARKRRYNEAMQRLRGLIRGWYPTTFTGKVVASAYVCVPVYLVATGGAILATPAEGPIIGGMGVALACMAVAKRRDQKPFARKRDTGFTLIELLVVIAIIGLLAAIILPSFGAARTKAQYARTLQEFRSIETALQLYSLDHKNQYPPDSSRGLPSGAEQYIAGGTWPVPAFPNAVYDWDAWSPSDLSYPPYAQVYQISVRFCSAPGVCTIPNASWAQGFDYNSALYYCVQGPCRSHSSEPVDYPGLCVNC